MAKTIKIKGKSSSGSGGGTKILLEFPFTQKERDNILKYCSLREDIKKRFRKLAAVGSLITVVFDKSESNEMLISLSQAIMDVAEIMDLKKKFEDLHDRFKLKYNEIFYK